MAYSSIIFFGFCGLEGIKKINDAAPGLILNQNGFTDNSSGIPAGFVPWSDVKKIEEYQIKNQHFIAVIVTEPDKYIQTGNIAQRMFKRANLKMCGAPINISTVCLKVKHDDLLAMFNKYYLNSKA